MSVDSVCNKIKYASEEEARTVLSGIKSCRGYNRREKKVYFCIVCDCYHLTSTLVALRKYKTKKVINYGNKEFVNRVARKRISKEDLLQKYKTKKVLR